MKKEIGAIYHINTGDNMNWNRPMNFNQKMQWLKLYDNLPIKTCLADKYAVREWIKDKIGEEYLVPLIGHWESAEEIDFNTLPNKFCLKANHGSGMNWAVKNKGVLRQSDIRRATNEMNIWMERPFGTFTFERQYWNIPRKIVAEQYIEQNDGNLLDYKIHCFNGVPKLIQLIGDRDMAHHKGKEIVVNMDWKPVDLMYHTYDQYNQVPRKPDNFDELIWIATTLSKGFIYVRVDLYDINGKVYFGEMTFTPAAGYLKWENEEANKKVGSWIKLPKQ